MVKLKTFCGICAGKCANVIAKMGPGNGKNFPGLVFCKVAGQDAILELSNDLKLGSVLVTGTNGKTTTTTLLIKLISKDIQIRSIYENNTINSIATGLITQKGDLGVFEYGIRNLKYGIPDTVQRLVNPIGVVYTTISQEHTMVNGVENPFSSYYEAKTLLSKNMDHGIIVANCDDPYTALIGINKEKDVHVTYYGLDVDIEDFDDKPVKCPNCGEDLNYSKKFLGHRGIYSCKCGFKRPEPDVKLTNLELNVDNWKLSIDGEVYNYFASKNVKFNFDLVVPPFGEHNIYNTLASITAYVSYTPDLSNFENNIKDLFNNLDMSFIPPGRFELINYNNKLIGIGQGDNGDALRINARMMGIYADGPLHFIYTTPDELEDDIFEDHLYCIKKMNPDHITVIPGRKSVEKAEEYYKIIEKEFDSTEFIPIPYDEMNKRISTITDLSKNSAYDYVIITGCGEEIAFWQGIKKNFD